MEKASSESHSLILPCETGNRDIRGSTSIHHGAVYVARFVRFARARRTRGKILTLTASDRAQEHVTFWGMADEVLRLPRSGLGVPEARLHRLVERGFQTSRPYGSIVR